MSTTPDRAHAAGMLEGLVASHTCGAACTGSTTIGRLSRAPKSINLSCPLDLLDLDNPADRRIIQSMHASEARAAMRRLRP